MNRHVIVTGAGSGVGRALAEMFVAEGATVVAADIDEERLDVLRATVDVTTVTADISTAEGAERVVAATDGRVDVLNNVAGVLDGLRTVHEVEEAEWARVLAVNVTAPYLLCHRVVPMMLAHGGGVITNVASIAGLRGGRAGAAYTASKHALVGLSQNIAATYAADGIRCNAICPGGIIGTNMLSPGAPLSERGMAMGQRDSARPEPATAEDIAGVAIFLAGPAAGRISGVALPVDMARLAY